MWIAEWKRLVEAEGGQSKQMREIERDVRTLGRDGVGRRASQPVREVRRVLCVGRVERLEIGRAGLWLGDRGRELREGVVAEAGEDLLVQVLQVHIDRRELWGRHGCVGRKVA